MSRQNLFASHICTHSESHKYLAFAMYEWSTSVLVVAHAFLCRLGSNAAKTDYPVLWQVATATANAVSAVAIAEGVQGHTTLQWGWGVLLGILVLGIALQCVQNSLETLLQKYGLAGDSILLAVAAVCVGLGIPTDEIPRGILASLPLLGRVARRVLYKRTHKKKDNLFGGPGYTIDALVGPYNPMHSNAMFNPGGD